MAGFAKFDGIDGAATDAQHAAWVNFLSLDWGVALPRDSTGQGRRRGAVVVDDLTLEIEYEKAAPKLLERCLRGQVIRKLEIELTKTFGGARATYLRYELKNVLVTSYSVDASGADDSGPPTVNISLSFEEIKVTYTEVDANGAEAGTVETKYAREKGSTSRKVVASATATKKATRKTTKKTASKKTASKKRTKTAGRKTS